MKTKKLSTLLLIVIIFILMLACTINIGGPDYPDRTIQVSDNSTNTLQTAIAQSWQEAEISGEVILTIDEMQLTSYLAMKLQQQQEPFITNPQVFLQDNQIQVFGTATQGYFQATASMILTAGIDENGQLAIELNSANFGPLPVPSGVLDAFTAIIIEAYTGSVGPIATGIRLTNITIDDGIMTITGRLK